MVRSGLPLPSLLRLFGPLLMLSLELFLGLARLPYDLHITHPKVQKALGFAVERYNKDTGDSTNYFKYLKLVKGQREVTSRVQFEFTVVLVETTCEKKAGKKLKYKNIQKCEERPGTHQTRTCFFKVVRPRISFKMRLTTNSCT